jgi:hypothetical protein
MPEQHTVLGGKVYVYKRPNSSLWQCSTYLAGKNRRISTQEESLAKAKEIAEDWYLKLRGKLRSGEIKSEKTFREVSAHYLHEYDIITQGQLNQRLYKIKTVHPGPDGIFVRHTGLSATLKVETPAGVKFSTYDLPVICPHSDGKQEDRT